MALYRYIMRINHLENRCSPHTLLLHKFNYSHFLEKTVIDTVKCVFEIIITMVKGVESLKKILRLLRDFLRAQNILI